MNSIIEEFGQSAGKVWQALYEKGPLSETKLINTTFLNEQQLLSAIGWLAREDKICRNGTVYKIGGTNLTAQIGTDAGKVWSVLSQQQSHVDIDSLARLTKIDIKELFAAIGWLARENKIIAQKTRKQNRQRLTVGLRR